MNNCIYLRRRSFDCGSYHPGANPVPALLTMAPVESASPNGTKTETSMRSIVKKVLTAVMLLSKRLLVCVGSDHTTTPKQPASRYHRYHHKRLGH